MQVSALYLLKGMLYLYCSLRFKSDEVLYIFSVVPLSFFLSISNRSQGRAISRRNTKEKSAGSFGE